MKWFIILFCISLKAQDYTEFMPSIAEPMPVAQFSMARVMPHGCTNCPSSEQVVVDGIFYLTWVASKSSNVVYQIAETTNIFKQFFTAGATTNTYWKVYVTNSQIGLFKVRATNQYGFSIWTTN